MSVGSSDRRLVVVGKGAPDRGGIAAFLRAELAGPLGADAVLVNLAHDQARQGGRLSTGNLRRTWHDVRRTWTAARGADVVHVHTAGAPDVTALRAGALALAARLRGARVVVHVHGGKVQLHLRSTPRRLVARLALSPAHALVAVSSGGAAALSRAVGADRVRLVDNGVDLSPYGEPEAPHDPPRLLYVGLLTPRKGVLDLLAASRLLHERGVQHELWLVGGTPDEGAEAEGRVREALGGAGLEHVRVLGELPPDDLPAVYAQADLLCLPSWWEAMPLSVLEAMAAGLPVVASDVGDVARVVEHDRTGLVVPARDVPALAKALEHLLTDPELRVAWGRAGRERVRSRFSAARLWEELDEVLGGRS